MEDLTKAKIGSFVCVVGFGTANLFHRHEKVVGFTKLYLKTEWSAKHSAEIHTSRYRLYDGRATPADPNGWGGQTVHLTCQRPPKKVTEDDIKILVSRLINEGWDKAQYKSDYTNDAKFAARLVKAAVEAGYAETYVDVISTKVRVSEAGREWLAQKSPGRSLKGEAEPYFGPKIS